jgi:4-carboxymuconolactone decarboxylase
MTSSREAREPRIPPRSPKDWDAEVLDALSVLIPPDTAQAEPASSPRPDARPVSNIVGTFVWHPPLTKAWLLFNGHLFHSTLSDRIREMVTVRIAWLRRGEYEWAQHVRMARAAGLSDDEIAAISEGPDATVWEPFDATLLRAVDELCAQRNVSDETWGELARHLDRKQLMDLVFTVGAYDLLAMAFNTFGLELDPDLEGFPAS